jgi:hypothetical protein
MDYWLHVAQIFMAQPSQIMILAACPHCLQGLKLSGMIGMSIDY